MAVPEGGIASLSTGLTGAKHRKGWCAMKNDCSINMDEPRRRLAELREFIPNAPDPLLYDFGRFLASYIKQERLVPIGFVMGCMTALHDLERGVDSFTRQPIRSRLVGYPPMIYALLRMEIPQIADLIFPQDFAEEVKKQLAAVEAKVR